MSDATAETISIASLASNPKTKISNFLSTNVAPVISSVLRKYNLLNDTTLAIIVSSTVILCLLLLFIFNYLHKKHQKIKLHQKISVNCHFCNNNQFIKRFEINNWTCQLDICGQYNGFDEFGDYNDKKKMTVQKYEGFNNSVFMKHQRYKANIPGITEMVENKFKAGYQLCDRCNDNQVLKLREEREFDPSDIESDDEETLGRFFYKIF